MTQWKQRDKCISCQSQSLKTVREETNSESTDPMLKDYFRQKSILVCCADCGMAFVQKIPLDAGFYDALYRDTQRDVSIDFHFSGKRRIFSEVREVVNRHLRSGKLLDIGAGTGVLIKVLSPQFSGVGIELGPAAREFGRTQNIDLIEAPIDRLPFPDSHFDLVTLIDVLEHLADTDRAISEINRVLRPGGIFFIKVPNYRAQAFKQDILNVLGLSDAGIMGNFIHINHYSPQTLKKFLVERKFTVLEQGFTGPEVWDLRWKAAPKSVFYRLTYNALVISISKILNALSKISGLSLGLNHFILVKKAEL